jgi:hypothetical protein
MASREQWCDLAAVVRAAGHDDPDGMAYIVSTTPDRAWLVGCLAGLVWRLWDESGADPDAELDQVMTLGTS